MEALDLLTHPHHRVDGHVSDLAKLLRANKATEAARMYDAMLANCFSEDVALYGDYNAKFANQYRKEACANNDMRLDACFHLRSDMRYRSWIGWFEVCKNNRHVV